LSALFILQRQLTEGFVSELTARGRNAKLVMHSFHYLSEYFYAFAVFVHLNFSQNGKNASSLSVTFLVFFCVVISMQYN